MAQPDYKTLATYDNEWLYLTEYARVLVKRIYPQMHGVDFHVTPSFDYISQRFVQGYGHQILTPERDANGNFKYTPCTQSQSDSWLEADLLTTGSTLAEYMRQQPAITRDFLDFDTTVAWLVVCPMEFRLRYYIPPSLAKTRDVQTYKKSLAPGCIQSRRYQFP